ncbi:hypothetical protein Pmani_036700 [Petrolisthes manimaculis]|uniref:Uncharacterized protein n=1 Tax=Petrolisthes manimaculis TaxID=1843537 RepID=A0AAE1TMF3_9EUCA|nr:hypothetical protein Pmani_036700 [Petrolisthes manimaculis]
MLNTHALTSGGRVGNHKARQVVVEPVLPGVGKILRFSTGESGVVGSTGESVGSTDTLEGDSCVCEIRQATWLAATDSSNTCANNHTTYPDELRSRLQY